MTDTVAAFSLTVPANTPIANPATFNTNIGLSDVQDILITVPPGCAGLVGFSIYAGGSPAYPRDFNTWFIFDDFTYDQEVSNQIDSGQWSVVAYNLDTYAHTINFYFRYNYVTISPGNSFSMPVSV